MKNHHYFRHAFFLCASFAVLLPTFMTGETSAEDKLQTPITTAQDFFETLDSNDGSLVFRKVALPPKELKTVVETLRKKYPFESLTQRLEYERKRLGIEQSTSTQPSLEPAMPRGYVAAMRGRSVALQKLHSIEVEKFINREGFGLTRVTPPNASMLEPRIQPIPLTRKLKSGDHGRETVLALPVDEETAKLTSPRLPSKELMANVNLHASYGFAPEWLFGYMKSRDEVAGFPGHGFTHAPWIPPSAPDNEEPRKQDQSENLGSKQDKWIVSKLELISLLKHEKPAAYISDNLPRMKELTEADTRELDQFEADALKKIEAGEDVITKASLNHIYMVGSVRARKQCVSCHYVKEGDLLGAFSYELDRTPPVNATVKPAF